MFKNSRETNEELGDPGELISIMSNSFDADAVKLGSHTDAPVQEVDGDQNRSVTGNSFQHETEGTEH